MTIHAGRRRLLCGLATLGAASTLAATRRAAHAQQGTPATPTWAPDRPIRILVPFAAGGTSDILARATGERLTPRLGQPVIVENRPGAGGNIAAEAVLRAPADGHTLLLAGTATLAINPALYPRLPFDAEHAFAAIGMLAEYANVLLINPAKRDFPDLRALLDAARREPGQISYASNGAGSVTHLTVERMALAAGGGAQFLHVPYRGSAPGTAALLAGDVTIMFDGAPTAVAQIRNGALKGLAVTTRAREPALLDLPTMVEAGLPGFEAGTWFALFAASTTPPPALARLITETAAVTNDPDFRAMLLRQAAQPSTITAAQMPALLAEERRIWGTAVRQSGARVE
jgi:tripartite-type tricarboxylate transporter receptor subunit TctC